MSQWVKCLMCKQDALCLSPQNPCESWTYSGNICNPSPTVGRWSAEHGGPWKLTGQLAWHTQQETKTKWPVSSEVEVKTNSQGYSLIFTQAPTLTHWDVHTRILHIHTHIHSIPGMVIRMWNSSVWEAEMGVSQFQGPYGEFEMTLGYIMRLSPQKEKKSIAILVKVLSWPVFSVDGQIIIWVSILT